MKAYTNDLWGSLPLPLIETYGTVIYGPVFRVTEHGATAPSPAPFAPLMLL